MEWNKDKDVKKYLPLAQAQRTSSNTVNKERNKKSSLVAMIKNVFNWKEWWNRRH